MAAALTARAMRDNPTTVAMFGTDPLDRLAGMQAIWTAYFHRAAPPQLAALYQGCLVGVGAAVPPGGCIGTALAGSAGEVLELPEPPVGHPDRPGYVRAHYAAHDLLEPHWHVGPVAVEPRFQGVRIGETLMRALLQVMGAEGSPTWGETDTEANVRFYTALGWSLVKEVEVIGIPLWFLRRAGRV